MKLNDSPVDLIKVDGQPVYVKRDDLLHPQFSGNKARKFLYFHQQAFPQIKTVLGYGSAQANSLYSLAALCHLKEWNLKYYVDHVPSALLEKPLGNYAAAIDLGATIIKSPMTSSEQTHTFLSNCAKQDPATLFIAEGGRMAEAEYGVCVLADEIAVWFEQQGMTSLMLFLPSGTGTTALFLSKYFKLRQLPITVSTCAVVGGESYLKHQFSLLCEDETLHPNIVSLSKKYHFGKCYKELLETWQKLNQSGIMFELLYDPLGWLALLSIIEKVQQPVMYLHQGGILGNESMLPRYQRKFPSMC